MPKIKVRRINEQNTNLLLFGAGAEFALLPNSKKQATVDHLTSRCHARNPPIVGTVICVWDHRLSEADKIGWFPNELPFLTEFMAHLADLAPGRTIPDLIDCDCDLNPDASGPSGL